MAYIKAHAYILFKHTHTHTHTYTHTHTHTHTHTNAIVLVTRRTKVDIAEYLCLRCFLTCLISNKNRIRKCTLLYLYIVTTLPINIFQRFFIFS